MKNNTNPSQVFHEYISEKPSNGAYIGLIPYNLKVIKDLVCKSAKSRHSGLK